MKTKTILALMIFFKPTFHSVQKLIHHFHSKSCLNFRDLVLVIFKHCVRFLCKQIEFLFNIFSTVFFSWIYLAFLFGIQSQDEIESKRIVASSPLFWQIRLYSQS